MSVRPFSEVAVIHYLQGFKENLHKILFPPKENPSNSQRLESDFVILETIGEGGFGVVYKAKHKIDGGLYAVKEVTLHNTDQGMVF